MEILIIAAIAAALIYKFYTILGEKRGFERPTEMMQETGIFDDVIQQTQTEQDNHGDIPDRFQEPCSELRSMDNSFSLGEFLKGATVAFEMILDAWAEGDRETLSRLLDREIYREFEASLDEREKKGHRLSTTLVKLAPPEVMEIKRVENAGIITVKYVSEQTNILSEKDGRIVEGSPNQIEEVVDIWTFRRDFRSTDPNWVLVETGS